MNSNKGILERASQFETQIKGIFKKYSNKDLSGSLRNDGLREIAIFNEQVESFSFQLEGLESKAKSKSLAVISKLKKLSAGIEKSIHSNTPASEYL